MENEKILGKIKKLFALANNNPSEEEAKAAALKAQELLAQYHIDYSEVENIDLDKVEEIEEVTVDIPAKKWKYTLARIVADNFRCKHFYYGKKKLVFYGHKTDANVAAETFKYLFNIGNALGNRLYYEAKCAYEETSNVYNSCVLGFCAGVREALAEQSRALMVIVPEDVKTAYTSAVSGARSMNIGSMSVYRGDAYEKGRQSGYNAMKRNAIEG
jgi:hypothetical protein